MTTRQALRLTHVVSTICFMACIGYIFALALHQQGVGWWVIFSLSGHSAVVVLTMVSFYLFALFRGIGEAQQIEIEHPLTTTNAYMGLYVAAPLLGGLAGTLTMALGGTPEPVRFFLGVAMATLLTTFVVWVVVDPIAGLIEMALPASRRHRLARLAQVEAQRRTRQEKREQLLTEALTRDEQERQRWRQNLRPHAERLAGLLVCDRTDFLGAEREAVDIGANAWRLGGLSCMRQLHDMTIAIRKHAGDDEEGAADCIAHWWDGIGDWRRPSFR
jgi:hypothetical protein